MTAISKSTTTSKSRTSIFSTWTHREDKSKDRSPITPFSPSSTTSSPLPSTVPNSPLSDPFSCSIALPEPYRPSLSLVSPTFETHPSSSNYTYNHDASGSQHTKLVNGTAQTPEIVVASPSTGTIHYLFPDLSVQPQLTASGDKDKRGSRLDPSAAKTIARSIFKRQSKSVSDLKALSLETDSEGRERSKAKVVESFYIPYSQLPPGSRPDPLRPAKRVVSGASTAGSTTSKETTVIKDGNEKHPLSMRTLRRQPSMADLTIGRRRGEGIREAMKENDERGTGVERVVTKRQSGIWNLAERRESDTWRDLVDSMTRDQAPISTELVSPTDKTHSSIIHKEISRPQPPTQTHIREQSIDNRRRSSSLSYMRPSSSLLDQSPSIPCPDFGDPIDFSVAMAESPSYSHFDYSTAGSSAMSRSTTISRSRAIDVPMSADMARGDTRKGLGSYETAKQIARDDAARRLAGEGPYAILRRSMSFKKDAVKDRKSTRHRSQSVSARSVRDMEISSPVPMPMPANAETIADKAKNRQSLGPSRGIYLGDLSVDLGGRYTPTSPASSDATSLYPASGSSAASYRRRSIVAPANKKPLHPALNGSEISILAPSSVGLGFSPVGTQCSLPESLEAEAIDLTGSYTHRPEPKRSMSSSAKLPKRSTSLHRIVTEKPPLKAKPAEPAQKDSLRSEDQEQTRLKPRRSFLLAQNTFYIPPLAVPPSLRSSRSLSTLKLPIQSALGTPTELLPPAPVTTNNTPVQDRRPRNGGFNLCSSPDTIDPLPRQHDISPGVHRKKSTPFLTASASIRRMFRQNSTSIARTLSNAFEKDPKSPKASPSTNMSPGEPEGEREWREGLLREAVTSHFSRTDVNSPRMAAVKSSKRLPIPPQMMESYVVEDEEESMYQMEVEVEAEAEAEQEQAVEANSLYSPSQVMSRAASPVQKPRKLKRPPTPTSRHEAPQKDLISPPLPLFADLSRLTSPVATSQDVPTSVKMERPHAVCISPVPTSSQTATTTKLVPRRTSVSTTLGMSFRSLTLRPKKSKTRLQLPQPISSTTRLPPRPLLDELTALEQQATLSSLLPGAEDKARKVLEWRSEVEENGDLAALEEKMTKHVEREKEWMRMKKKEVVAN